MFGKLKEKLTGAATRLSGKADLLEAICASVVVVGAADGDFADDEAMIGLDRIQNHDTLSKVFTPSQIEAAFEKQAKRAKQGMTGRLGLYKEIEEARAKSTTDELEILLMIAIDVASADGDIGSKEQEALNRIARSVGLNLNTYL